MPRDLARVDELFARGGERWSWYSVADLAGQRLGADAQSRSSLPAYFAARAADTSSFAC